MNLILLFKDDFVGGHSRVRLKDRRYEHVRNIHRASIGDELCVGLCGGKAGMGKVTSINDSILEMDVKLNQNVPSPLPVTLVLALPRPIVCKRIFASISAMGVKHLILFHSSRVEKSYWKSPVLKEENIKEQFVLGLEQARDTILPEVQIKPKFKPFVEDELPGIAKNTLALVAHPETDHPCPQRVQQHVTLVIGPEGGFIPYEIKKLNDIGFRSVHLGERILRVESVIPALLSKIF